MRHRKRAPADVGVGQCPPHNILAVQVDRSSPYSQNSGSSFRDFLHPAGPAQFSQNMHLGNSIRRSGVRCVLGNQVKYCPFFFLFQSMCRSSSQPPGIVTFPDIFTCSEGALSHHAKAPMMLNLRISNGIRQVPKPTALATMRKRSYDLYSKSLEHSVSIKLIRSRCMPISGSIWGYAGMQLHRSPQSSRQEAASCSIFPVWDSRPHNPCARSVCDCWPGEGRTKILQNTCFFKGRRTNVATDVENGPASNGRYLRRCEAKHAEAKTLP